MTLCSLGLNGKEGTRRAGNEGILPLVLPYSWGKRGE
jgi:hypothetical protein